MANTIEGDEFEDLMHEYAGANRHEVSTAYQAVISYIDNARAERDKRIVAATVEACAKKCDQRIGTCEPGIDPEDMDQEARECAESIRAITPESVLADIDKQDKVQA